MKLGTYTTIDTPTKKQAEALAFLQVEFNKIGGNAWQKNNPHDFGSYPSFEIDKPGKFEYVDEDCCCGECEDCGLAHEFDNWLNNANEIEDAYSKKFEKYL